MNNLSNFTNYFNALQMRLSSLQQYVQNLDAQIQILRKEVSEIQSSSHIVQETPVVQEVVRVDNSEIESRLKVLEDNFQKIESIFSNVPEQDNNVSSVGNISESANMQEDVLSGLNDEIEILKKTPGKRKSKK